MKIDLTLFGLSIKPVIKGIGSIDHISERRAEAALRTTIDSEQDKTYLKTKTGFLLIEK